MGDSQKPQAVEEPVKYDFTGEIALYVLKSKEEQDFPPAAVNLYKLGGKASFNFVWVREKCFPALGLKDADQVLFYGGKDHTLCVKNSGAATLQSGQVILPRGKKYSLRYNDKLLMIFNDGETELELHYKNIKPSERER